MAAQRYLVSLRTPLPTGSAGAAVALKASLVTSLVTGPTAEVIAPSWPPLAPPGLGNDVSLLFRNNECWLWKTWQRYLRVVEPYRQMPNENKINFQRRRVCTLSIYFTSLRQYAPNDREVKKFARDVTAELMADFPDVPWDDVVVGRLLRSQERGLEAGLWPEHRQYAAGQFA